jgi:hypothetical protein
MIVKAYDPWKRLCLLSLLPLITACVSTEVARIDPEADGFEVPESARAGVEFRVVVVSVGGEDVVGRSTEVEIDGRTAVITPYHDVKRSLTSLTGLGFFFLHEVNLRFAEPGPVEVRIRSRGADLVYVVRVES